MSERSEPDPPYRTEQFAFVDEDPGPEVSGWLSFMNSRAGRRADRRERLRDRALLAGVLLVVVALVAALVAWSPWSAAEEADTGAEFLGADRVALLLQVQSANETADATAIVQHDRGDGDRDAVVAVPAELVLPVEGEGRLSARAALAEAGLTLSREAVAELTGLPLTGTWLLTTTEFAGLVDRLGGVRLDPTLPGITGAGAATVGGGGSGGRALVTIDGQAATGLLGGGAPETQAAVLHAFVAAFPQAFTATRDLLFDFGILAAPGLSVERLAAVLTGLARQQREFAAAALPVDPATGGLDFDAAGDAALAALGGRPGAGASDATPRVLVTLASGSGVAESDARADVLNAGYEYIGGGAAEPGAETSVTVRASLPDAQRVGEAVAAALNLPGSLVRLADEVPLVADVAVVLGRDRSERLGG